jgi:hypothetical protein
VAWIERYVSPSASGGGDGSVGSPWTLAEAAASAVAGDRVNLKAGIYPLAATFSPANDGARDNPIVWRAYASTPGDAVTPVAILDASASGVRALDCARAYHRFELITASGNVGGGPAAWGFWCAGDHNILWRCRAHTTQKGINLLGDGTLAVGCEVTDWSAGAGFQLQGSNSIALGCVAARGPTGFGFIGDHTGGAYYCVARQCAGQGFLFSTPGQGLAKLLAHCVAWANGGPGISSQGAPEATPLVIANSIVANNGGPGISTTSSTRAHVTLCAVGFYNNAGGDVAADVTVFEPVPRVALPGNPFVDADAGDLRPAPAARAVLGSGFPGERLSGGSLTSWRGAPDLGAVHQVVRPVINPLMSGAWT